MLYSKLITISVDNREYEKSEITEEQCIRKQDLSKG